MDGQVAIVTGAAGGIGAAVTRVFAREGARVLVTDVRDEPGGAVAAGLGAATAYHHLDVREPAQWADAVAAAEQLFGRLTVLVNNAGVHALAPMAEQSPETFHRVIDVNLYGPWLGMRAAAPALRRAGGGVIVNVSSTAGLRGFAGLGAYGASKWGLRGLTKVAALELAPDRIRVCSIHPGLIRTAMTAGMEDAIAAETPVPRFGTADEVAVTALFVVTEATYSTGEEFVVDGGATTGTVRHTPDGTGDGAHNETRNGTRAASPGGTPDQARGDSHEDIRTDDAGEDPRP